MSGIFLKNKRRAANLDSLHSKIHATRPAILRPLELHYVVQFLQHHPEMCTVIYHEIHVQHVNMELFLMFHHTAISKKNSHTTHILIKQNKVFFSF